MKSSTMALLIMISFLHVVGHTNARFLEQNNLISVPDSLSAVGPSLNSLVDDETSLQKSNKGILGSAPSPGDGHGHLQQNKGDKVGILGSAPSPGDGHGHLQQKKSDKVGILGSAPRPGDGNVGGN